jgi:hypothetical protein
VSIFSWSVWVCVYGCSWISSFRHDLHKTIQSYERKPPLLPCVLLIIKSLIKLQTLQQNVEFSGALVFSLARKKERKERGDVFVFARSQ